MPAPPLTDCAYTGYPCNYNNMVNVITGEPIKVDKKPWYRGYNMVVGAKLYVGVLPAHSASQWWLKGPPQSSTADAGPFFTTVIKRAAAFNGTVLEYSVLRNRIELVYTIKQGGFETQEDVFAMRFGGYFSCKECEVSVKNELVADFVDWRNVKDVTSIVLGTG